MDGENLFSYIIEQSTIRIGLSVVFDFYTGKYYYVFSEWQFLCSAYKL